MNLDQIFVNKEELIELPHDLYIPPDALKIFLDMFEGPLDLLLYLIRRQNLDILQIPIAKITDQYVKYINAMQVLNIELAGEYLLMAAVLLEIKSRIMLPKPKIENNDGEEDVDPRQKLIQRLIEYERIKQAGMLLNDLPQANRDYLWIDVLIEKSAPELPNISPLDLQKVWQTILTRSLNSEIKHHVKKEALSVREHMSNILRVLQQVGRSNFYDLFEMRNGIQHIVVNFIAILELTKEGLIGIEQTADNSDIFVGLI